MRTVYVAQSGATVRRESARLQVFAERRQVAEVPVHDLGQLVLVGNVVLTHGALDLLLERNIDVVFLSHNGRYRGRLVHGLSGNIRLRLAQHRALTDAGRAAGLARAMVAGKIANMRGLLQRHARRHGPTPALERAVLGLAAARRRLELLESLDQIRGCEGSATAAYFRAFADLLRVEGFYFDGRNRRPPLDPVNAVLSLGYTLLANVVESLVEVAGLDPYFGALHAPQNGRPSLVCDLMEEHRAPAVDALVVAAINRGALQVDDFEEVGAGEPVLIRREAFGRFARLVEKRMTTPVHYPAAGKQLPYRQVIEQQVRHFARVMIGEDETYSAYVVH